MDIGLTEETKRDLENAVIEECYSHLKEEERNTESFKYSTAAEAYLRYETCVKYVIPWIKEYIDLNKAHAVEIGCGAGSATAALAQVAQKVFSYDVQYTSINMTKRRAKIMKLNNIKCYLKNSDELLGTVKHNHNDGVDVILLYALLEHLTIQKRIEALKTCWELLKPDGLLVVGDTPNRLQYWDKHTSFLPFFNMLPDDLALIYYQYSPRDDFRKAMSEALQESKEKALEDLAWWGRGVSYHEFEISLGGLDQIVVGDGYDPEIIAHQPVEPEEIALKEFIRRNDLKIPLAFTRTTLSVILKKQ